MSSKILVFSEEKQAFLEKRQQKAKRIPPIKPKNKERRSREYLTEKEVNSLLSAAQKLGKNPKIRHRNYTLILMLYRHGFRISEALELYWRQIDFEGALVHIIRKKNGKPSIHPLDTQEMAALRKLRKLYPEGKNVFCRFLGSQPMSDRTARDLLTNIGKKAELDIHIHPHMLRHACGFYLANKDVNLRVIQDYLGHKDINHTVRYTDLAPNRFNNLWSK